MSHYVNFYFYFVIIIGSFFLVNLTLVILKDSFGKASEYKEFIEENEKEKEQIFTLEFCKKMGIWYKNHHLQIRNFIFKRS